MARTAWCWSVRRRPIPGPKRPAPGPAAPLDDVLGWGHRNHRRAGRRPSRRGLVHRGLSPAKVLITEDGHVKLLGFGLARLAPGDPNPNWAGTAYLAPEQTDGRKVDARADLFSLGGILRELVAGRSALRPRARHRRLRLPLRQDPSRRFQHVNDARLGARTGARPRRPPAQAHVLETGPPPAWCCWPPEAPPRRSSSGSKFRSAAACRPSRQTHAPAHLGRFQHGACPFPGRPPGRLPLRPHEWQVPRHLGAIQWAAAPPGVSLTKAPPCAGRSFSADGSRVYYFSTRKPAGIYEGTHGGR